MLDLPTDLLLNVLIAVLLAATIFFCVLLDRRLRALRSGQDGLKATIDQLNTATARAEVSIGQLKQASGEVDTGLSDQLRRARAVTDELSVMLASGNSLADRLEGDVLSAPIGRSEKKVIPMVQEKPPLGEPFTPPATRPEQTEHLESGLNQTLLDALKKAR